MWRVQPHLVPVGPLRGFRGTPHILCNLEHLRTRNRPIDHNIPHIFLGSKTKYKMQALRTNIAVSTASRPSLPQRAVRVQASKAAKVRKSCC